MKPISYIKILLIVLLGAIMPSEIYSKDDGKKFTVVIDAGHGGKDVGATDNGVREKDINLKVAKHLESLIKKKLKNTNVVMTRDNDTYLTLQERADKANKAQGDLFISIHTNSVAKKNKNRRNVAGSSVYTLGLHKDESNLQVAMRENSVIELESDYEQKYSGFDPQKDESYIIFEMAQKKNLSQSIKFADAVEKELVNKGRQGRGVHQAGFWVLWATSMPAVLVELDFICNPQSAKYMSSDKGAEELADAIFKAVEKYEATWNKLSSEDAEGLKEEVRVVNEPLQASSDMTRVVEKETPALSSRRRRSKSGRESLRNVSYEYEGLNLPENGNTYVALAEQEASPVIEDKIMEIQPQANKKSGKENKKKEKKVKEKKTKNSKSNAKVNKLVTVYKIQILASEDLLKEESSRFCGLAPITAHKENNLYKYYYGESTDKEEIEKLLPEVREKIPDAFIVSSTKTEQKQRN